MKANDLVAEISVSICSKPKLIFDPNKRLFDKNYYHKNYSSLLKNSSLK